MSHLNDEIVVRDDGLRFLRALLAVQPDLDWIYLLEKPWKWQREYELWQEHGRPTDPAADTFNVFTEAVDSL